MEPETFFHVIDEVINEYHTQRLPIPESPLVEEPVLEHMQVETLARKLDKKVRELGKALARAQASEEQERRLLHMVAHDLRAPATIIRGQLELFLESLATRELNEHEQASIEALQRALKRMRQMINDLTVVTRLDTGEISLKRKRLIQAMYRMRIHLLTV
jgi:signal transduction histidine kinase